MKNNDWGIAMEGCGLHIKKALLLANKDVSIKDAQVFRYIEIGVAEGRTIARVCDFLEAQELEFYADGIDIIKGWSLDVEQFYNNTKAYGEYVSLRLGGSPLELRGYESNTVCAILIDGNHSRVSVIEDFTEADRIIAVGGVIMFHDSAIEDQILDTNEGQIHGIEVRPAIKELGLLDGWNEKYKIITDISGDKERNGRGIFIVQRVK